MTYKIDYRFWGTTGTYTKIVENANIRDRLLNELRTDNAITYIGVSKVLKDGTIKPMFTEIMY